MGSGYPALLVMMSVFFYIYFNSGFMVNLLRDAWLFLLIFVFLVFTSKPIAFNDLLVVVQIALIRLRLCSCTSLATRYWND